MGLCEGVVGVGNLGCNWAKFYFFREIGRGSISSEVTLF